MGNEVVLGAHLNVSMSGSVSNPQTTAGGSGASEVFGLAMAQALSYSNGTAANEINLMWSSKGRTLASSASEELDLHAFTGLNVGAGAGNDPLGVANTWAELVAIVVVNESGSTGNLIVGQTATTSSETFTSIWGSSSPVGLTVLPGGVFAFGTPVSPAYPIVGTTNYILHNSASGGAVIYDIYLYGRNA